MSGQTSGDSIATAGTGPRPVATRSVVDVEVPLGARPSKRWLDLALLTVSAPLWIPLMGLLALAVKLEGSGPVFFRHERIGFQGRVFCVWKFRSMVADAATVLQEHLDANPDAAKEWNANYKLKNDPRITRLGRFLRKSSLDELPQLFNVITGEMSLVGPRPIVEEEAARYGSRYEHYLEARPGLTGLWQISGRNDTTYDQRVRLDSRYVRDASLSLDLLIIVRTVGVVLRRTGAY